MSDLDALFRSLKPNSSTNDHSATSQSQSQQGFWAQPQQGYQPPSVSSPLFSPPVQTPNPHSGILSPAGRNSPFPPSSAPQDQARANNLLNLLKFNGGQQQSSATSSPMANLHNIQSSSEAPQNSAPVHIMSRNSSARDSRQLSDLVSSLQRQPSAQGALPSPVAVLGAEKPSQLQQAPASSDTAAAQDFLLNLLSKPSKKSASGQGASSKQYEQSPIDKLAEELAESSITPADVPTRESTPIRQFGSPAAGPTRFEAPQPTKAIGLFNYVNPFDQLHASSPLNRSPKPEAKKIEILKHDRSSSAIANGEASAPAAKSRKLASPEKEMNKHESESEAAAKVHQSVSEKLTGVGEKVDKEVEKALAQAGASNESKKAPVSAKNSKATPKKKGSGEEDVDSNWSTAEDEDAKSEEEAKVAVYNFPMKPFVTLQITSEDIARPLLPSTWESSTPIARLKKEFSHDDRCLAAASQAHIFYAVVPSEKKPDAGLKIIRQEDGKNKHVWAKNGERLCNVQVASAKQEDVEAVLATGVNGTIFYATFAKSRSDLFDDDDVEGTSFIMSPPPNSDEPNSASGFGTSSAIKTRAKLSNRHPAEYFAVARGRQIHLIAPRAVKDRVYTNPQTRKVNTEKYLSEHSLSINTSKAGKDFCFSEDDTVLASLDKVGRVKFWDVRTLTSSIDAINEGTLDRPPHMELKDPIFEFATSASPLKADEKMSPSSIMFLDKERPTSKGIAMRYLLLGYQQNHILQLWDLGLGKCVQELRFPEPTGTENSNGMCSVSYHAKTGILTVGHPGRNSIYFIHLSAPKYAMPTTMSQAVYVSLLSHGDTSLPRPESTAIMSGIREFTLGKVGDLRSVDMLKTPFPAQGGQPDAIDETLFELYVMHSKGVVGLLIKRPDLGWDAKSKMVKAIDAIETGVVKVSELLQPKAGSSEPTTPSQSETITPTNKPSKKAREAAKADVPKPEIKKETVAPQAPSVLNGTPAPIPSPLKSKQIPEAPSATNPPVMTPESYSAAAQPSKAPQVSSPVKKAPAPAPVPAAVPAAPAPPAADVPSKHSDADLQEALSQQFAVLYQKIDQDKRISDAAGAAKQDAMLRLVSSTLTENVETSLHKIVGTSIEEKVIPALTTGTGKIVERKLTEALNKQLGDALSKEVEAAVPGAVQAALRDAQVTRAIASHVVDEVTKQVKMDMGGIIQRSMQTVQTNVGSQVTQSSQSTQKMIAEMEGRFNTQLREAAVQRQHQNDMLVQLTTTTQSLADLVQSMKAEHGKLLTEVASLKQAAPAPAPAAQDEPVYEEEPQESFEEAEISKLTKLLIDGDYEQATIDWLQSARQAELFDALFVRLNPLYLQQVSPLVALSVSAAVTASFETNVEKRLEWLGTVIANMDSTDPDIRDVAPKIMDVLSQRLQGAYMQIAENRPNDTAVLRNMSALNRQIGDARRRLG